MRITTYRAELDENQHNILVKEKSCNCLVESLNNPDSIAKMLNTVFGLNRQAEEYVYMIALNIKNKPLGVFEISHGTVNQSILQSKRYFY